MKNGKPIGLGVFWMTGYFFNRLLKFRVESFNPDTCSVSKLSDNKRFLLGETSFQTHCELSMASPKSFSTFPSTCLTRGCLLLSGCQDNVVCLSPRLAQSLGNMGQVCVCVRVTSTIHLIDPNTLQSEYFYQVFEQLTPQTSCSLVYLVIISWAVVWISTD